MPRLDRTGPSGYGPGTGLGMGPCGAGMAWGRGRGFRRFSRRGLGRGLRRFWGYGNYLPEITKDQESETLRNEVKSLEEELKVTRERLSEIESQK